MIYVEKAWKFWGTAYEKNSTSILVHQNIFLDLWCEEEMLSECGDLRPWQQQEIQEAKVQISVQSDQGPSNPLAHHSGLEKDSLF